MRLEEPESKRQKPDVAEVPDEEWEFTLPGAAGHQAASADRATAQESASADELDEYIDDVYGTLLKPEL
eukprot:6340822-Amphidinium_carterae.1